ncbi:hypothetical protein DEA98_25320 [Brucella pseudogrignonensis]|nr:hypothetical protein [Brucella pseudogrignonensis]
MPAIDRDGIKTVNARYGHAMGDAILEATARRLTAITGDGDLVARMGETSFDRPLWRSAERHPSGGCDCRGNASTDPWLVGSQAMSASVLAGSGRSKIGSRRAVGRCRCASLSGQG